MKALGRFADGWRKPPTRRDRVRGALVGAMGCFWLGGLGRVLLGPLPVSLGIVFEWSLVAAASGVILGVCFPKAVTCVCFPFATFG